MEKGGKSTGFFLKLVLKSIGEVRRLFFNTSPIFLGTIIFSLVLPTNNLPSYKIGVLKKRPMGGVLKKYGRGIEKKA